VLVIVSAAALIVTRVGRVESDRGMQMVE
jgi:hypothetical protein